MCSPDAAAGCGLGVLRAPSLPLRAGPSLLCWSRQMELWVGRVLVLFAGSGWGDLCF